MKIAVITSSYPRYPGDGAAPFVKSICEHLAKLSHEIEVVAPYDPDVRPDTTAKVPVHRFRYVWPEQWHIMGHARSLDSDVRLRPLTFILLPLFLTAAFITLWRVTGKQKSQVIYAHWAIPNGLVAAGVAMLRRIPFILSLHGSDMFVARFNPLFATVTRWIFRRAAGVTACSAELHQIALTLGAPQNTLLLAYGANPAMFYPERRSTEKRSLLSKSQDDLIITAVGRFVYKKGFSNLLAAMPTILKANPNAHLILVGDGALKDEFQQQASRLGITDHVTFPGRITWDQALPDLLANADIFVLPSVRDQHGNVDGLPTILLEAMSSGTAIVASEIGGVTLVLQDRQNGLLTPPGDTDALAKAINYLAENPDERLALGQAARLSVVERYNWDQVARNISTLLASVTHSSGA